MGTAEGRTRRHASKVMVTGGTGSLGRRVVERLRKAGLDVTVLSRDGRPGTIRGDLLTGEGLDETTAGVDTIVHCASRPSRARETDIEGTKRLVLSADRAGAAHLVFVSIVGVDRNRHVPYYRAKLEAERVVEGSPVPWTILRATQFHEFALGLVQSLDRFPVMVAPKDFLIQPVETGEVADQLVALALSPPSGRVPDVGGPEVLTFAALARAYFRVSGRSRRIIEIPVPGGLARAFREGAHVTPDRRSGTVTWESFLHRVIPPTRMPVRE